jgi:hypothetical protein
VTPPPCSITFACDHDKLAGRPYLLAAGNDQTHNRPNPKEARSKKSMIRVEDDTNMKTMVELQCLMMMPHFESNNLFFSPMWVARVTTMHILVVVVI